MNEDGYRRYFLQKKSPGFLFLRYVGSMEMLHRIFEFIALAMETLAVAIAVLGAVKFLYRLSREDLQLKDATSCALDMSVRRMEFGGYILASLEVLIVADIIKTITSQSQEDLIYLAVLTAVRIAIGYFLDQEMRHMKTGKKAEGQ